MKKLVIISNLAILLFASCATQKKGPATTDDVYANPKEYRSEEIKLAAERKQAQEVADKRYNDSIASVEKAQKDKDEANPYYKDREFKYDDYYDYEYATRVKRFNNNINGLSYYDNYYTNSYWYNQNPYNYGVSVYNGYSWWGSSYNSYSYNPSVNFYNSWGWGCNSGYGYNGYNPYLAGYAAGYNNGFNNGMYGNYYGFGNPYGYGNQFGYGNPYGYGNQFGYGNPYGYGGGFGFNDPYNNGWGYFNSYDYNSSYTYGFRSSHGGGNSRRTSNPVMTGKRDSYLEKYVDEVKEQQVRTVKFSDPRTTLDQPVRVPAGTGGIKAPNTGTNGGNVPIRSNTPVRSNEPIRYNEPIRSNEPIRINEPIRNSNPPVRQNPIKTVEPVRQPVRQPVETTPRFEAPIRQNNPTPNTPINNGGSNPPPNNSGGHRPR